jgi:hypothetical protein
MLVAGLVAGYFGQPLLTWEEISAVAVVNSSAGSRSESTAISTPDANRAVQQQELMNTVVEQTRHFRGDLDAHGFSRLSIRQVFHELHQGHQCQSRRTLGWLSHTGIQIYKQLIFKNWTQLIS